MNRWPRKRRVKFALLAVVTALLVICRLGDTGRLPVFASISPHLSQIDRHSKEDIPGRDIPGRGAPAFAPTIWSFSPRIGIAPRMGIAQTLNSETLEDAASLTLRGREQLAVGDAEAALATWQAAQTAYTRLEDSQGIAGSRINQSLALQALGRSRGACGVLLAALGVEGKDWCDPFPEGDGELPEFATSGVNAIGLRSLGDVLRSIGNLDLSEAALTQSLQMARDLDSTPDIEAARLSWGNTQNAQYRRLRDLSDRTESTNDFDRAVDRAKMALDTYKTVGESLGVRAKLNRLSLLLDLHFEGKTQSFQLSHSPHRHPRRIQFRPHKNLYSRLRRSPVQPGR